jgi:hypothetical protein
LRLTGQQSWLYYWRPLAANDRVQYEFFYAPGETEVHPTLGRFAFLLAPDGVHTHWITSEQDRDVCQLSDTNALLETECQRSAGSAPLRINDWNTLSVQVTPNTMGLELNGTPIFERPLNPGDDTRFGLFRDGTVETKVRNAVLTGEWPTSVPTSDGGDLLALTAEIPAAEQRIQSAPARHTPPRRILQDIAPRAAATDEQAFATLRLGAAERHAGTCGCSASTVRLRRCRRWMAHLSPHGRVKSSCRRGSWYSWRSVSAGWTRLRPSQSSFLRAGRRTRSCARRS